MTAPLTTPSPYLRNHLLRAADGLRDDAETARLNLAEAEQDVAAAQALLAEAEAQRDRAQAEVDGIAAGIAWVEREAARLTPPDPDRAIADVGLMREERTPSRVAQVHNAGDLRDEPAPFVHLKSQDNGLPMTWSDLAAPGGYVCAVLAPPGGPGIDLPDGTRICGMPVESEPCSEHGPDGVPPVPREPGGGLMREEPQQVADLAPFYGEDVAIRTFGGHKIAGHLEAYGEAARVRQSDGQDCYVSPACIVEIQRVAAITGGTPMPSPDDLADGSPLTTRGDITERHTHRADSTETGRLRALTERVVVGLGLGYREPDEQDGDA